MKFQAKLRFATCLFMLSILFGCASPATRDIALNPHDIQREEQAQYQIARQTKAKSVVKRKYQDLRHYQAKLQRVAPPLMRAAQKICRGGNCSYNFKVANQNILNAWADGHTVYVTPVMIDFLDSDKELAIILAHELSHNIMGHIGKQQQNALIGAIFDIAAAAGGVDTGGTFTGIGASSYSQSFENEADYIAIYIMALAGYDISNVHHIWRKMSIQSPSNIGQSFFSTHPSNSERFLRMQKAINEVKTKKANGLKLNPNYN
jgi:predicted Zn-dependent protease